jgi:ArsR family metal-binding transcriptional regulator
MMKDKPELNFITYIFMLYQSGLIALGKLENGEESRTLLMLLSTLRMNFVEESGKKTVKSSDKLEIKENEKPEVH